MSALLIAFHVKSCIRRDLINSASCVKRLQATYVICSYLSLRDRSLFITWGGGGGSEDFGGDQLIFRRTEGGISRN